MELVPLYEETVSDQHREIVSGQHRVLLFF